MNKSKKMSELSDLEMKKLYQYSNQAERTKLLNWLFFNREYSIGDLLEFCRSSDRVYLNQN